MIELCPAQELAYRGLERALAINPVALLGGDEGSGKTTVLEHLRRSRDARLITLAEMLAALESRHPLAMEETFEQLVRQALEENACVIVDEVDVLNDVVGSCRSYPRSGWLEAAGLSLCHHVEETGRLLVFGGGAPQSASRRAYRFCIHDFQPADYEQILKAYLPATSLAALNCSKIHRFAPGLNGHQLRKAALWLAEREGLDTERFIDYLRSQGMTSNVDLAEVRSVTLRDLQGIDSLIEQLETQVVLPLENDELATEYGLKPKRGVLLLGPPGTGKTTIGRALAHRLKSKFFLVDGTVVAGGDSFYYRLQWIFQEAKRNAPSIIFIDDCDAIFQSGQEPSLYRYLLTMLDGLESESLARVCVIMTAMDLADLPPALVRSGRIELWLETKLPDEAARRRILQRHLDGLPGELQCDDFDRLVAQTEGFTGADLGPLVDDGKNRMAFDHALGRPQRAAGDYFFDALESILGNKERYAAAHRSSNGVPVASRGE